MVYRFILVPLGEAQVFTAERFRANAGTWRGALWLTAHLPLRLAFLGVCKPWLYFARRRRTH